MLRFKLKIESLCYIGYVILLYVLAIAIWSHNQSEEFQIYKYVVDINGTKLAISIVCSLIMLVFVNQKYFSVDSFTNQVLLLLILLYFLPGIALAGILNYDWNYIIQYFLYFLILMISDYLIPCSKLSFNEFTQKSAQIAKVIIVVICIIYPVFMARVYSKSFSVNELILTLNDPYGVRAASKEININWIILAIEYASIYFDAVLISYFIKTKRMLLAFIFVGVGLFYFILQGNRQFVLFVIIGLLFGFLKPNKRIIAYAFLGLMGAQLVESLIIHNDLIVGPITNVYRRFSLVPNILSSDYYDFFQDNQPDYLRGVFTRICSLLGLESHYGNNQIGYIIGKKYYGWAMNANTGLFGGACFEFGDLGFIVDPIMLVIILRLIEKLLSRMDRGIKFTTAFVFSTITINQHVIWAQSIKPGQYLLFLLLLLLFFNSKDIKDDPLDFPYYRKKG